MVWACLKGYPPWPGKVLSVMRTKESTPGAPGVASASGAASASNSSNAHTSNTKTWEKSASAEKLELLSQLNVRFFGAAHDTALLPYAQCFLLSRQIPVPTRLRTPALSDAVRELKLHIGKLRYLPAPLLNAVDCPYPHPFCIYPRSFFSSIVSRSPTFTISQPTFDK